MTTLADEILDWLPGFMSEEPRGATVADICEALIVGQSYVRAAAMALDTQGRAIFLRYPGAKTRHLVPLGHDAGPGRGICANCRVVFEQPAKGRRICCGRSCAVSWQWKNLDVAERRRASILAERATPEAHERALRNNAKRWAREGERERLSEQNRRMWADPAKKAQRSASIQAVNGSAERRANCAAIRRELWSDPEYRARATAAIRASKTTDEARAKHSQEMKRRWADPLLREKYLAATRDNCAKAAAAAKGRKQSPEQVSKRIERTLATKALFPRKQSQQHIRKRVEATRRTRSAHAAAKAAQAILA